MKTVLIVDDSLMDRILMKNYLIEMDQDLSVIEAWEGEDAFKKVSNWPSVDLILLDLNMPKMDGREFLRRIKQRDDARSIPVILVSASSEIEIGDGDVLNQVDDRLTKPFSEEQIQDKVARYLR